MRKAKDWFPNDKATHEWLDGMKKSSRQTYQTAWKYFLEFTGLTGDEILADKKRDRDYSWEKKTLAFRDWMIKRKKQSENAAKTATTAVRSFFTYHRSELKFRRTESARLTEAKRKHEDYRFSLEDLQRIAQVSNLEEKYVVIAGKSFGLRAGDFLTLRRGDLEPYIDRSVPISIGEYPTQKEGIPAFPFIDSDAQPIIKLMLQNMKRKGHAKPNDRMLTYKHGIQLSRVLRRVTEKAGITIGNKRVRFHCLRKFLIDHLSSYMSESKWKQIVGKTISEEAYVSPDTLRDDYTRAMSETCFRGKIGEKDIRQAAKVEALRALAKSMGITGTVRLRKVKRMSEAEEIEELEKLIEDERKKSETDTNGGWGKQKVIAETELSEHLQQGWRVVSALPSGNVVIER